MIHHNQPLAAVCMRGHVVTSIIFPDYLVPNHCRRCGAPVLTKCFSCPAPILGTPNTSSLFRKYKYQPDPFCWSCGRPYPWATRQQRLGHLYNLIDFQDDLDEADRLTIMEQVAVLSKPEDEVSDEQRVQAGSVIKRLAPKMWEAALPILQTVLSAELRKQLGLP